MFLIYGLIAGIIATILFDIYQTITLIFSLNPSSYFRLHHRDELEFQYYLLYSFLFLTTLSIVTQKNLHAKI